MGLRNGHSGTDDIHKAEKKAVFNVEKQALD